MRIINKTETIKIIHDCAVLYDRNLTIDDFALNSNLYDKVDFANLTASFDIPKKPIIEH
jgi:hypothetical protein